PGRLSIDTAGWSLVSVFLTEGVFNEKRDGAASGWIGESKRRASFPVRTVILIIPAWASGAAAAVLPSAAEAPRSGQTISALIEAVWPASFRAALTPVCRAAATPPGVGV